MECMKKAVAPLSVFHLIYGKSDVGSYLKQETTRVDI